MEEPTNEFSTAEIRKDALQDGVEAATAAVGKVTSIVVGAVGEIAKAVGGLATDLFEIKDAARRAGAASADTAGTSDTSRNAAED